MQAGAKIVVNIFKVGPKFYCLVLLVCLNFVCIRLSASEPRYVSTSLASDEILFELLSKKRMQELVGVSNLVDDIKYSNIVQKIDKHTIQRVSSKSIEKIVELRPTHVFIASFNHPGLASKIKKFGIKTIYLESFSKLSDIESNIQLIANHTNSKKASELVLENFSSSLNETKKVLSSKNSFLLYLGDLSTAGKGTLFDDMVSHIGGTNLASAAGVNGFSKVSTEWLNQTRPDFIIYPTLHDDLRIAKQNISRTPGFSTLKSKIIIVNQAKFWATSHHLATAIKEIVSKVCQSATCRN